MHQITEVLCDTKTCTRPGCSAAAGCQGHVERERAPEHYRARAEQLVADAASDGFHLTIELPSAHPPRMGHYAPPLVRVWARKETQ